jgi:hypothetical protein
MDTTDVKQKDKKCDTFHDNKQNLWNEALRDAEVKLRQAHREVMDWKAVVRICRERITKKAPWPGTTKN